MFLEDDNAPQSVAAVLANLPPMTGCDLSTAVLRVAESLILGGAQSQQSQTTNGGDTSDDHEEEDEYDDDDDDDFADDPAEMFWFHKDAGPPSKSSNPVQLETELFDEKGKQRIRLDIAIAKAAGFKVACYGNIFCCPINFHMCLSIRMSKLGISQEAMEAWNVVPEEYLVLALCFKGGYKGLQAMLTEKGDLVKYKIGISKTYRIAYTTLTAVFGDAQYDGDIWRPTFISKALEELMNEGFHQVLRNRSEFNLNWAGAERLYHTQSGHQGSSIEVSQQELPPGAYPQVVSYDHLTNPVEHLDHRSFPLVAMQFMLRHFVRCTDFCLVCHRPLDKPVEAIKPYVCENPLCLYQFMSLGFGPGIEHEILTQPMVVDLLISFAWCAAKARRIVELPKGLGLLVPSLQLMQLKGEDLSTFTPSWMLRGLFQHTNLPAQSKQNRAPTPPPPAPENSFQSFQDITMNYDTNQLFFHSENDHKLATGTWLAIIGKFDAFEEAKLKHHRVIRTYPSHVDLGPPVFVVEETQNKKTGTLPVKVFKYDQNFDVLPFHHAQPSVLMQINLLPSVSEMENYLKEHPSKTLSSWTERLSPAALGILRWIIASNRSCIQEVTDNTMVKYIEGMKQFRFAMGAPVSLIHTIGSQANNIAG
jgi:ubiquitin-conjugating enzyme E2 Q